MYASKRTIGRQQLWAGAPAKKETHYLARIHRNNGNKRGHKYYCQVVKDKEDGHVIKTIWHATAYNVFNIKRKHKALRKCMS